MWGWNAEVGEARSEEMEFIKSIPVYVEKTIKERWDKTGKSADIDEVGGFAEGRGRKGP